MKPGFGTGGGVSWSGIDPRVYMAAQERDMAAVGDFARVLGGTIGGGLKGGLKGAVEGGREQVDEEYKRLKDGARAADYFMKAAGEEGFQSAGLSKDEWDTMGAREKLAAVKGIMQAQTMREMAEAFQSRAQEREMRQQRMTQEQEERGRMASFNADIARQMAPIPGTNGMPAFDMTASPQTKAIMGPQRLRPEDFMRSAARAGVLDPAMVAKFMEEDQGSGLINWQKSPGGGDFGTYKNTVVHSEPKFNGPQLVELVDDKGEPTGEKMIQVGPNSFRKQTREAVPRMLPDSFFNRYEQIKQDLSGAEATAAKTDEELKAAGFKNPAERKASAAKRAEEGKRQLASHLKLYRSQGYGTPEFWDEIYQGNGLKADTKARANTGEAHASAKATGAGKELTPKLAQEFLAKAGGDKSKARELAREAGYRF